MPNNEYMIEEPINPYYRTFERVTNFSIYLKKASSLRPF